MYLYESCLGDLFTSSEYLDYEQCYCEQCGDSDNLIAEYETNKELWEILKPQTSINNSGGWSLEYIAEFICDIKNEELEDLSEKETVEIIERWIESED